MCNRYVSPTQAEIERYWHIGRHNQIRWETIIAPRRIGPFLRAGDEGILELAVGNWGLIPRWSKTSKLQYATNNCRAEEMARKPAFRDAWNAGQRCIIPAISFDEPCWETGKNVWWNFRRIDGQPMALAGLWNAWLDQLTGELVESYTMLTVNADEHPVMSRMHKPDPTLPANQQDKRSVVSIEPVFADRWLRGDLCDVEALIRPPAIDVLAGAPIIGVPNSDSASLF